MTDTVTAAEELLARFGVRPPDERVEYADAVVAEQVVTDVLGGTWLYTAALDWLHWDGRVWAPADDAEVIEVVRGWAVALVSGVASTGDVSRTRAAAGLLGENRITRVVRLCRGMVLKDAADFDSDADVLNVRNGVIDLRSGKLMPHDPGHLVTKCADADYQPGATHPDWDQALEAIPDTTRAWLQARLGQAASGHTPDDDVMLLLYGGGENGKTTILDAATGALGTYARTLGDRVLTANGDQHPTEMMDLRGLRLAIVEEMPDGRRLSVSRVKKAVGTPTITARLICRDSTTFRSTHALVVSSNYRPLVEETDHGTWRRLALVSFPFRYRKPEEPLIGAMDRRGSPRLKPSMTGTGQRAAILAWLVEGAARWYQQGRVMPPHPERIVTDTRNWRAQSDLILAYVGERLVADQSAHLLATDLYSDFIDWAERRGQQPWSDRTVASRMSDHDWAKGHGIQKQKVRARAGLSRSLHRAAPGQPGATYSAWTGVRFRHPSDESDPPGSL